MKLKQGKNESEKRIRVKKERMKVKKKNGSK